jgi:hypothetical protein
VQKPCNINVKYIDSVPDWSHNFPVAKRKENFRHFNSLMVLIIHLAMDWNEMNQGSVHGNLPDIFWLFIGHKLTH